MVQNIIKETVERKRIIGKGKYFANMKADFIKV